MIASTINPYWGKDFFEFVPLFFVRLFQWMTGDPSFQGWVSDEVQLFVLVILSLSSCLLGPFLVLRKMTMLANSLSHTILLGIVISYVLLSPFSSDEGSYSINIHVLLIASLITGLVTTLLTQILTQVMKLQEDASIGLVFTTLFALGIVLATCFTRNAHIGIEAIMGNVDALHIDDLKIVSLVALINLSIFSLFYKEYKITTFDSGLANSFGISTSFFNHLLMIQVAATAIGAFRAVGVLLFLAFLIAPALTARLLTNHLYKLLLLAVGIGVLCSFVGVALSRHILSVYQIPLSTAGLIVTLMALSFLLAILFAPQAGLIAKALKKKHWKKAAIEVDN